MNGGNTQAGTRIRYRICEPTLLLLLLSILCYTFFFSRLAYTQFKCFESRLPIDMAVHNQYLWNTANGQFLQQTIHYYGGPNHFYLILAILAPIYRFFDTLFAPLLLYTFILATGAIPIYLLAKDHLQSKYLGLIMGIFYLACPETQYFNLQDIKPTILSVSPLLFSFYFWHTKNFRWFLISLVLASLTTEVVGFFIMMYAPLSWIKKRDRRWILLPLGFGAGLLIFCHGVFVPLATGSLPGSSIDHDFFQKFHPLKWDSYKYIFRWLGFGAVLLLFCREAFILATPCLFLGAVFTNFHIRMHHYFPLLIVLFISLIYCLKKVAELKAAQGTSAHRARVMPAAILAIALFFAFDPFLKRPTYHFSMEPWKEDAWELIQRIPQQASVSCDSYLLPALSMRARLHEFSRAQYHGKTIDFLDVDYILIQPKGPLKKNARQVSYVENARRLLSEAREGRSEFEVAATKGDWVLFHRKS